MRSNKFWAIALGVFACCILAHSVQAVPAVRTMRVPDGGIQPQVVVGPSSRVHLIYFKGNDRGDIYYVSSTDGGKTFSKPIRINSTSNSVIAAGSVRGAHIALGKDERVHVAWMGDRKQTIDGVDAMPMLYTRMNDSGTAFEHERNVISQKVGLDGGGSIAADRMGNVYVTWHAPPTPGAGEQNRTIWIAKSSDNGATFAPEQRAWDEATGACGCCGMRAFADSDGDLFILYRAAKQGMNRDMYVLEKPAKDQNFSGAKVADWKIGACVMSTAFFAQTKSGVLAAWEAQKQVYFGYLNPAGPKAERITAAPGNGSAKNRKHPVLASNSKGDVLLAWTEDTAWAKGGTVAWQVYDADGKAIEEARGKVDGLPVWSLPAAFADAHGDFVVLY
jgi:hypothetical protein